MNCDKIGNCDQCPRWFDEGKDFCKCCGFDLNSYNKPEEEEDEEEARMEEEECVLCGGFCSDDYQADVEGNEETVCEDCFERLEKCEMCGDATDEEEWCDIQADVLYCSHCKAKHQATIAKCEAIVKSSSSPEEALAKYLESKAKAVAYNPLEGLNAKQIARIERIRAEREIARIQRLRAERLLIVVLKELSDVCRGCHKLIDEDGMCSPGCDYYIWEGDWTCDRCDTERYDEPYCKKCCHPDDIALYASEYAEREAISANRRAICIETEIDGKKERETILKELREIGLAFFCRDGVTEVSAVCYGCGLEGKCLQDEDDPDNDWLCVDCSSI